MKWLDNFLFGNPLLRIVPPLEPLPFVTEEGREIERLRAELAAAIEQRDDARRDACAFEAIAHWEKAQPNGIMSECAVVRISREIAFERGWDCFKKRGGA